MFFKAVWKELREEGWTSKRPPQNALDSFYRYIRPGSDLKGKEGKHFFCSRYGKRGHRGSSLRSATGGAFEYVSTTTGNTSTVQDSLEELQEAPVQYSPSQVIPTSFAEVEASKPHAI
ncbi:uncharacterized protein PITG_13542 [Phytophthora infestans T30-4]|uniref:Uncharacterized protein n=1 Tax=Phytophthora infestans (strain T30-4) TaxID=403677 RepID=D0NM84_PHYIT|nr:uncharacterized protein PITG_13542 [Phytophthora infestans T30-4]EEY60805.1 hypothetical protein PITG_13542 [Phytophthora infestans T30-4]|eukprot:XP_002899751.1 hypothetical protein PITG_13542 [Phytophthora infestans T30-4]